MTSLAPQQTLRVAEIQPLTCNRFAKTTTDNQHPFGLCDALIGP